MTISPKKEPYEKKSHKFYAVDTILKKVHPVNEIGFVIDPKSRLMRSVSGFMDLVRPDILEERITSEWPGTQRNKNYKYFRIRLNSILKEMFTQEPNVFKWDGINKPEDLSFYHNNQMKAYVIAHEGEVVFVV
jgi:hypothetical protein